MKPVGDMAADETMLNMTSMAGRTKQTRGNSRRVKQIVFFEGHSVINIP